MRVSHESARGCGFRKGGGLYLVSDGPGEECEFLPHVVESCPTCGQGIKPARGWTWVHGHVLFPPRPHGDSGHNAGCPFGQTRADEPSRLGERCGLLWVGEAFYGTPREFMYEAERMGISRRITAVPRGFEAGRTWVLLGHRKAVPVGYIDSVTEALYPDLDAAAAAGVRGDRLEQRFVPGIFSAFQPRRVEYVVKGDETDEELAALENRGIEPVQVVRLGEDVPLVADDRDV